MQLMHFTQTCRVCQPNKSRSIPMVLNWWDLSPHVDRYRSETSLPMRDAVIQLSPSIEINSLLPLKRQGVTCPVYHIIYMYII